MQITVLLPAMVFLYLCLSTWHWPQGTSLQIKGTLPCSSTTYPSHHSFSLLHVTVHHAVWHSSACRAAWNTRYSQRHGKAALRLKGRWGNLGTAETHCMLSAIVQISISDGLELRALPANFMHLIETSCLFFLLPQ